MALPENQKLYLVTFEEYRRLQSDYDYEVGFADGYKQAEKDISERQANNE